MSFLCRSGGSSEELPSPPPPGRSPEVRLRPPPSLSLQGSQHSFQETNKETESRTMPQKVTMTDRRLTEISVGNEEQRKLLLTCAPTGYQEWQPDSQGQAR